MNDYTVEPLMFPQVISAFHQIDIETDTATEPFEDCIVGAFTVKGIDLVEPPNAPIWLVGFSGEM